MNDVAYKLALPSSMPIHDVFHVSLLKPYHKGNTPTPPPLPILVDGEYEYEVERILMHRDRKHGQTSKREYLVKWQGYGPEHCTWEGEKNLANAQEILSEYWDMHHRVQEATQRRSLNKRKAPMS